MTLEDIMKAMGTHGYGWNLAKAFHIFNNILNQKPEFKFALREDVKNEQQFLPTKAEPKASGWDVRSAQKDRQPIILKPFQYAKIDLGIRSFCPDGWWWELRPRSSTFAKKNLHSLYGVIDETFSGSLVFACQYIPDSSNKEPLIINFGDAIGQIIPVKRQEMHVIDISNEEYDRLCEERNAVRKDGGFGSTSNGNK